MPRSRTVNPVFCSHCGARLRQGAKTCPRCGKEVPPRPPHPAFPKAEGDLPTPAALPPLPPSDKRPRIDLPRPPAPAPAEPPVGGVEYIADEAEGEEEAGNAH